ncbi:hypothetical protein LCGC14_0898770 [marine sediment metagenome]|uniref:Uncharacterized protein n=1 Tax=marine sediment metagenome TaxID=412755 RepID=A0A0F9S3X5_9ZZZZ
MGFWDSVKKSLGFEEAERYGERLLEEAVRETKDITTELVRQELTIAEETKRVQDQLDDLRGVNKSEIKIPAAQTPMVIVMPGQPTGAPLDSWGWANKYLQVQRQVAQARAVEQPPGPVEELTIEKVALPAAGIGLAWWLLKGF